MRSKVKPEVGNQILCPNVTKSVCFTQPNQDTWESDKVADETLPPSHSNRFPPILPHVGPITAVYFMLSRFDEMTDRGTLSHVTHFTVLTGCNSSTQQAHKFQTICLCLLNMDQDSFSALPLLNCSFRIFVIRPSFLSCLKLDWASP